MTPRHRRAAFALLALAVLGWLASLYLVFEHARVRGHAGGSGACDLSERFNCAAAAMSTYADIGGVPISGIGAAYYLAFAVLVVFALLSSESRRSALVPVLAGLSFLATVYSAFLLTVSLTKLTAVCPGCSVTYLVNAASFAFCLLWLTPQVGARIRAALANVGALLVPLSVFAALLVGGTMSAAAWSRTRIAAYASEAAPTPDQPKLSPARINALARAAYAPSMGPSSAPVVISVFSDFECPHCARFAATLRRLHRNYGDNVRVEYRSYPLPMHKNAELAARIGVCAQQQGKFWSFHDLAFEKQDQLSPETLPEIVDDAGLNPHTAMACADLPETRATVAADIAAGEELGIQGTPAFVLNGELTVGAVTYDDLEQRIGRLLQSNERAQLAP